MNSASASMKIAKALVEARRHDSLLDDYPGLKPASLSAAYQIQDAAISLHGGAIGGWKVGRVADDLAAQYGSKRLAGPIFSNQIVFSRDSQPVEMPMLRGFAAVEAELMLRIGHPSKGVRNTDDARSVVDEIRFGLEIASSPFRGINEHGPAVTASDFGNNYGLVIGPVVEGWRDRDLANAQVELMIDGAVVGRGKTATMLDGPFGSVAYLMALLEQRGIAIPSGTWVSTGAITGVHQITVGQTAVAVFGGREAVSVSLRGATDRLNGGEK